MGISPARPTRDTSSFRCSSCCTSRWAGIPRRCSSGSRPAREFTELNISADEIFHLSILATQIQAGRIGNVTVPVSIGSVGASSVVFISPRADAIYSRFRGQRQLPLRVSWSSRSTPPRNHPARGSVPWPLRSVRSSASGSPGRRPARTEGLRLPSHQRALRIHAHRLLRAVTPAALPRR